MSGALRTCKNGCGRNAFASFATCCRRCGGPDGPHSGDCAAKSLLSAGSFLSEEPSSMCSRASIGTPGDPGGGAALVVRVLEAKLARSFDTFGKMDPFAIVVLESDDGSKQRIGRTKSAWGAHMTPVWEHTCRPAPYCGSSGSDKLVVRVEEENFGGLGKPTFCGEATAKVNGLLTDAVLSSEGLLSTGLLSLTLFKKGEETGNVVIQLVVHLAEGEAGAAPSTPSSKARVRTKVDVSLFETPVHRIGVSGGTAPFFALRLIEPTPGYGHDYWIGKDLSRAMDEIGFYENILSLKRQGGHGLDPVFDFMFEYSGVLECMEAGVEEKTHALQLLVLRNLRSGLKRLRMLDIKIGEKTASAGWKGKSRIAALRQSVIDGLTNSHTEGFRLEGFDNKPPVLQSMDPLLDIGGSEKHGEKAAKKALRVMMQRMHASQMFMHLMDVHMTECDSLSREDFFTSIELAEIVLNEMARKLVECALACRKVPVPQKWIGSSVALGFDDMWFPSRTVDEEEIRRMVIVKIFDWGRSELNTLQHHCSLPSQEQDDRVTYWNYYVGGIDRLAWAAARAYKHRFGNDQGWNFLILDVYDFDSASSNDFIGRTSVALPASSGERVEILRSPDGDEVDVSGSPSTITYSLEWVSLPSDARLSGFWELRISSASNLPARDFVQGTSDPLVVITATTHDESYTFQQLSTVKPATLNPAWNETFQIPVARQGAEDLMTRLGLPRALAYSAKDILPAAESAVDIDDHHEEEESKFEKWRGLLVTGSGGRSFASMTLG